MAEPGPPSETNSGADSDQDFEPTAEMMVDDFDDEGTMAEEEQLEKDEENTANVEQELDTLEAESKMSIEQLMALYGYNKDGRLPGEPLPGEEEEEEGEDESSEEDGRRGERASEEKAAASTEHASSSSPSKGSSVGGGGGDIIAVGKGIKDTSGADKGGGGGGKPQLNKDKREGKTSHLLRSVSRASESSNSDDDEDFVCEEYWRKTIQVGVNYQADIPENFEKYDDAPPYENEDKLLWDPERLPDAQVLKFYEEWNKPVEALNLPDGESGPLSPPEEMSVNNLPLGPHTRDDEQGLFLLLQCGYNVAEALRRRRILREPGGASEIPMTPWSEEECQAFESGLRLHGKSFHLIQQNKVPSRTVAELVQFYYVWKKTERHDVFTSTTRLEKRKYSLHPGTTDYMDKFLDEQESILQQHSPSSVSPGAPPQQQSSVATSAANTISASGIPSGSEIGKNGVAASTQRTTSPARGGPSSTEGAPPSSGTAAPVAPSTTASVQQQQSSTSDQSFIVSEQPPATVVN